MSEVELIAASLRADAGDVETFVEGLADKLLGMLPGRVTVQRGREGLLGPKLVRRIAVDAGELRLELLRERGGKVQTQRARLSGGIVLKNETVDIDTWLLALGEAVTAEARRSAQTRQALERLLIE